jgi:hypothetical protein
MDSFPFASLFASRGNLTSGFDVECRDAKRLIRWLRCVHAATVRSAAAAAPRRSTAATPLSPMTSTVSASSAGTAWREQRRCYRVPLDRKRSSYCRSRIETDRDSPRRLRRASDTFLGRSRQPMILTLSVDEFLATTSIRKWTPFVGRLKVCLIRFIPTSNRAVCSNGLLSSAPTMSPPP